MVDAKFQKYPKVFVRKSVVYFLVIALVHKSSRKLQSSRKSLKDFLVLLAETSEKIARLSILLGRGQMFGSNLSQKVTGHWLK